MEKTIPQTQTSLMKASQVALRLNVSRAHVYNMMRDGLIPTVWIGNARRVRPEDLERFIESNIRENTHVFFESYREV